VACEVGPLPVMTTTVSRFPLATCITPKRATGLVPIGGFSTPLRFIPIGHSLTPWGFIPIGCTLALSGFDGCRIECLDLTVAPKREIPKDVAFKLNQ
jgi:hypothetical protein